MEAKQHSKQYISFLRIFAAFFVIFNHSADYGFYLYADYSIHSIHFWVYLFFSVFSKVSVPLFFLISGALLLNKPDESLSELYSKRISKIVFPLVTFSLVYYLYSLYWSGAPFCLSTFLTTLYSTDLMHHLWYMYAYISFLLCLPFLRSMVKSLPNKYFYYMIGLDLFFTGLLPSIEYYMSQGTVSINHHLRPDWLLIHSVLCPCIGYFLEHRLNNPFKRKELLILWAFNLLGLAVSCHLTYYKANLIGAIEKTETFHGYFLLLNCITLFCTTKYLFSKFTLSRLASKIIQSMASCTFGVYLIHLLLKDRIFLVRIVENLRASGVNYLLTTMIYCACIFMISYFITFCLSKIPLLRKTVGFS